MFSSDARSFRFPGQEKVDGYPNMVQRCISTCLSIIFTEFTELYSHQFYISADASVRLPTTYVELQRRIRYSPSRHWHAQIRSNRRKIQSLAAYSWLLRPWHGGDCLAAELRRYHNLHRHPLYTPQPDWLALRSALTRASHSMLTVFPSPTPTSDFYQMRSLNILQTDLDSRIE